MSQKETGLLKEEMNEAAKGMGRDGLEVIKYLRGRKRHRDSLNITKTFAKLRKEHILQKTSLKDFVVFFEKLQSLRLGHVEKEVGKDYHWHWHYRIDSITKAYEGGEGFEGLVETDLHPTKKAAIVDKGSLEENQASEAMTISVDLRSDFKASLSLPRNLTHSEAEKIIKYIRATVV